MRLWVSVSTLLLAVPAIEANRQNVRPHDARPRANELTLAGIRPGRDKIGRVFGLYGKPKTGRKGETEFSWEVHCQPESLFVAIDQSGVVQAVQVDLRQDVLELDCERKTEIAWRTGRKLENGDLASRAMKLYGEPDSRSPSTKGEQQLELLYYAFDWAGPDVPQVLTVLCTVKKDRMPSRVVEITLAASSL